MTRNRKLAYSHLLYSAMLEIRRLGWLEPQRPKWRILGSPLNDQDLRHIQYCGELANALHNMAMLAAHDFEGFDEDWFWKDMDNLKLKFPGSYYDYRSRFEEHLAELESSSGRQYSEESATSGATEGGQANTSERGS